MAEETVKQIKTVHYFVILGLVMVASVAFAASGYFYVKYRGTQRVLSAQSENTSLVDLINNVGKLMLLPQETPTVATVSDITKLRGQAFFKQAKNGDKVLIYTKAREAILYRPSLNKIIAVSTVNVGGNQAPVTASSQPSVTPTPQVVRVQLFNGTTTFGLTLTAEKKLVALDKSAQVIDRSNAAKSDYEKTVVVDLSGHNSEAATQIASDLHGNVGALPAGEQATSSADILVILGKDFLSAK